MGDTENRDVMEHNLLVRVVQSPRFVRVQVGRNLAALMCESLIAFGARMKMGGNRYPRAT
jgi:hypothetical protein